MLVKHQNYEIARQFNICELIIPASCKRIVFQDRRICGSSHEQGIVKIHKDYNWYAAILTAKPIFGYYDICIYIC